MSTVENVVDMLGTDEQHILNFLKEKGFKGKKSSASCCVLARCLTELTGKETFVDGTYILQGPDEESEEHYPWNFITVVTLPTGLSQFISKFDRGFYPELVSDE